MATMEGKDRKPLHHAFPAWFYGPKGEAQQFGSEEDVPKGWKDHPSKHKGEASSAQTADEQARLNAGKSGMQTGTTPQTGAGGNTSTAPGQVDDLDSDGHTWNADLHAATKSKTNDGKWRMKVGVTRPAPAPGYPKPDAPREAAKAKGVTDEGAAPLDL